MLHRVRELLIRQRTMLVNALRGHLAEFGIVTRQGIAGVGMLIALVEDDERDPYLRRLLVVGAHAVLRFSRNGKAAPTRWATGLLAKKPYNVVAVALANKMARIVWAMMMTGRRFEASAAL